MEEQGGTGKRQRLWPDSIPTMKCPPLRWMLPLATACLLGCAGLPATPTSGPLPTPMSTADVPTALQTLAGVRLLLLGEQHDADDHQALQAATVIHLARSGHLAAVVLEMAERGHDTRGLPPDATAPQVQAALAWNDAGWPWSRYGAVVMAAVRAGVPVWGGNQPRAEMRAAMSDATLDNTLAPAALARQHENIRAGHCDLLPTSQLTPMARIQIARDRAMAQTVTELAAQANTPQMVLLVAGSEHVRRELGLPAHLPAEWRAQTHVVVMHSGAPDANARLGADRLWITPATAPQDHCAELRQRWGKPGDAVIRPVP